MKGCTSTQLYYMSSTHMLLCTYPSNIRVTTHCSGSYYTSRTSLSLSTLSTLYLEPGRIQCHLQHSLRSHKKITTQSQRGSRPRLLEFKTKNKIWRPEHDENLNREIAFCEVCLCTTLNVCVQLQMACILGQVGRF